MDICGISDALLLPVVGRAEEIDVQMARLVGHSSATNCLHIAYCVPNSVELADIASHLRQAVEEYRIEAVKIHPNVSRIDLRHEAGRARVESIVRSCGELDLPVIIHGGRSPMLFDEPAGEFAVLENLARVDWHTARSAVVISHFGSYGFDDGELSQESEKLSALLERHPNLMTDTSGLPYHTLIKMIPAVDSERILFGTDSLYVLMWQSVVTLMCALNDSLGSRADDCFCRITSPNVRKIFGDGQ
jgi:predicted TIM-barrel fold metal-dependent hydrolase